MNILTCNYCGKRVKRLIRVMRISLVGDEIIERRAWICEKCLNDMRGGKQWGSLPAENAKIASESGRQ